MLSLNHGVYIIEKGYKKTVCPDGKYFHQNKLFFIFTLIIFSEHSYFLRKSQITLERKQRKKYFLTPFALHWNIQTARKAFIYGLFRNLVRYSNSIVAGGFPVQSYMKRLMCLTSFTIRLVVLPMTSHGISALSAVMKSVVVTARRAMA